MSKILFSKKGIERLSSNEKTPVVVRIVGSTGIHVRNVTGIGMGGVAIENSSDGVISGVTVRGNNDVVTVEAAHNFLIENITHLGPVSNETVEALAVDIAKGDKASFRSRLLSLSPEKIDAVLNLWDRGVAAVEAVSKAF